MDSKPLVGSGKCSAVDGIDKNHKIENAQDRVMYIYIYIYVCKSGEEEKKGPCACTPPYMYVYIRPKT